MKTTPKPNASAVPFLLAGLVLPLAACGQPPVHVKAEQNGATYTSQPEPEARFEGVVRLRGGLAERTAGALFVSVKPDGVRMPSYSYKFDLSDAEIGQNTDGERVIPFVLDGNHKLGGLVSGSDHHLEAWFDVDGYVETKEGSVIETVPVEAGDVGIEVVLEGE